jgi:hypothetical protein
MELIRREYGRTLKDIERTLWPIIADYFLDRDGFIYSDMISHLRADHHGGQVQHE